MVRRDATPAVATGPDELADHPLAILAPSEGPVFLCRRPNMGYPGFSCDFEEV